MLLRKEDNFASTVCMRESSRMRVVVQPRGESTSSVEPASIFHGRNVHDLDGLLSRSKDRREIVFRIFGLFGKNSEFSREHNCLMK